MVKHQHGLGFVILFAVILVSIVLTISLSLLNITYKQLILSATARDSQISFFAADSAANCVQHYDYNRSTTNPFLYVAHSVDSNGNITYTVNKYNKTKVQNTLACAGDATLSMGSEPTDASAVLTFNFDLIFPLTDGRQACAKVTLEKNYSRPEAVVSTLVARGFSATGAGNACPLINDRTVERVRAIIY